MKPTVLKPGLLVSLSVRVNGGVTYARKDIAAHSDDNGGQVARWETERYIPDPAEFERATKTRGACRSAVSRVCSMSTFGLLCPVAREADLSEAIAEARAIADKHNAGAVQTSVQVLVMVGRIAQDDIEAARAISSEFRELIADMQKGIQAADVDAIREAANKARMLGGMLTEDAALKVDAAIAEARKAAREIVKRVTESGEAAAVVVAELNTKALESARFAFLDTGDAAPSETIAPEARGLDLAPVTVASSAIVPVIPTLEL